MENKPVITCHGDQSLFKRLHPVIVQGLPKERIEWKRMYGRPSRLINIEASFVPFSPLGIHGDDDWTLLGRAFFHVFWTECDIDNYKATVKDDISDWLAQLKQRNCSDWLIVVVVNEDSKMKSKILRTSVADKAKSDFCGKVNDRCIVLSEPFRQDSKSAESWGALLVRIKQLLLQSYNRNLGRFEDHMRNERERRTEHRWNFFQYFLLQEELAFMFEMLNMYEDALVQYDELDALFTQFILNHSAGDKAGWITELSQRSCKTWDGLTLVQPINVTKRQLIINNQASLLDFRMYLFSRQCTLFFLQLRPWEVAQRALPFMHNCLQELGLLQIVLPEGAISCWVYLCCVEVLKTCEKFTTSGHMEPYSLHTANLWNYARIRTQEMGLALGYLRPDSEVYASKAVEELTSPLKENLTEVRSEPLEKLREALTSKEAFQKHYLELSELAMGTYKHIGRIRSARQIGRDLALFYMKLDEYQQAEGFLLDSLKTYKAEGWDLLAGETRLHIAQCQKKLNHTIKYAKTCAHIATCAALSDEVRGKHQEELVEITHQTQESPLLFHLRPSFTVQRIEPTSKTFTLQKSCEVLVTLENAFIAPVHCSLIRIGVMYESPLLEHSNPDLHPRKHRNSGTARHRRSSSTSSAAGIDFYNHVAESNRRMIPRLEFDTHCEKSVNSRAITSSSIVCRTPLQRLDSGSKGFKDTEVTKEESSAGFSATQVTINPGVNVITLRGQLEERGWYLLGQLCLNIGSAEFLKSFLPDYITFSVVSHEPSLSLSSSNGPLIAGIEQEVTLLLKSGSHTFPEGARVTLAPPVGVRLGKTEGEVTVDLPAAEEYQEVSTKLHLLVDLTNNSSPTHTHQITARGCGCEQTFSMTVISPLQVSHRLLTARTKKFVQIGVEATTHIQADLMSASLTSTSSDLHLTSINKSDQQLRVTKDIRAWYMWQIESLSTDCPPVELIFSFDYVLLTDRQETPGSYQHSLNLHHYQTLYAVRCSLDPAGRDPVISTGSSYPLRIQVQELAELQNQRLVYEVTSDPSQWAFSGKTSGVVELEDGRYETSVEVTPLTGGCVPLPSVQLYQHPDEVASENGETQAISESDAVTGGREAMREGQVYNCSENTRVTVLCAPNTSHVDITVI